MCRGSGKASMWSTGSRCNRGAQGLPWTHPSLQHPSTVAGTPASSEPPTCRETESCIHDSLPVWWLQTGSGLWSQFSLSATLGAPERLGSPSGSPLPWEATASLSLSRKAPVPLHCKVIPAIMSLPFPSLPLKEADHRILWLGCCDSQFENHYVKLLLLQSQAGCAFIWFRIRKHIPMQFWPITSTAVYTVLSKPKSLSHTEKSG